MMTVGDTIHESTRRRFLRNASVLAATSFLSVPRIAAAEPPPETKRIRLINDEAICIAPQFLSEALLRMEGFTQVEYVRVDYDKYSSTGGFVAADGADIAQDAAITLVPLIDAGQPVVVLSGVHAGCWELIGSSRVRTIRDLKGKRVPIAAAGSEEHLLTSSMLAYVGMDPRKDVEFVTITLFDDQIKALLAGDVDAMIAIPPQAQRLRAKKIGHVIVDSVRDKPWAQYFCCTVAANRDFVTQNPVATKRALRAMLKAADICAQDPQRAARYLVAKGHEPSYAIALEVLSGLPYARWRVLSQ